MNAEHPVRVVDLLEERASEYRGAPRFTPERERWIDEFTSLRRRLRRAIAASEEWEARFMEMAERHLGRKVKALLTRTRKNLLACCDALSGLLRRSKDKTGRWQAESVLRVLPVSIPKSHGKPGRRAATAHPGAALKPLLDAFEHDEQAVTLLRQAVVRYLEHGEAKWSDLEMIEWITIGLPRVCDLEYVTAGHIGALKQRSPRGLRVRLEHCDASLDCLRQIEARLLDVKRLSKTRKDAAEASHAAAKKATQALAKLREYLDEQKELNETAYWLDAEATAEGMRGRVGARAYLESVADDKPRARRAVIAMRRLTQWLLGGAEQQPTR